MKLVATKLEMETVGKMSKLVIDNIDAIASDLTVLDSRLLLGNANIDVVALDGTGSLVLIAIDLASDEQLLLKAVEAYSWCLEYPEAVRRLYPAADVSVARPPRVMFVVERMSDSFHRKVKQLGFPEVDCVEFRHLAIDSAEAVHFDTVVRLRRATLVSTDAPASASTPVRDNAGLDVSTVARATSVKLQKLLTADAPSPSASRQGEHPAERPVVERPAAPAAVGAPSPAREPGVVVSMMNRAGRHAAARLEEAVPAAKQPVVPPVTRRSVRDAEPATELLGTMPVEPVATVLKMVVVPEPVVAPEPVAVAPVLELVVAPQPIAVPEPVVATAPVLEPVVAPQPIAAPEPVVATAPVLEPVVAPQPIAVPVLDPVVEAAPIAVPAPVAAVEASLLVVEPQLIGAPEPVAVIAPVLERAMEPIAAPEPVAATTPVLELVVEPEPITVPEPVVALAPVLELVVEPVAAPVIELVMEPEPVAAPEPVVAAAPVPERVVEPEPIAAPASVATAPEPPRISFADLSKELLASQSVERKPIAASKPVPPTRPLEPPASIKPAAVAGSPERLSFADLSKDLLGAPSPVRILQTNGPTPMRLQVPPVVAPPKVGEITRAILEQIDSAGVEPVTPILDIAPGIDVASGQPLTLESLVEAAAQTVPEPAAEAPETSNIQGLPEEFAGLKFPGDGVLTRQWMDFLNQMTATK